MVRHRRRRIETTFGCFISLFVLSMVLLFCAIMAAGIHAITGGL